jgi:hypothetical protein
MVGSEPLEQIDPIDFASFVESIAGPAVDERPGRWREHALDGVDLLVPLDRFDHAYATRLQELIHNLTVLQGRSPSDVVADVRSQGEDIIRVILGTDKADTIGLEQAAHATAAIRSLLVAGARAAEEPRVAYAGRASEAVKSFADRLRLGVGESGSYVLRVASPLQFENVIERTEPFGRRSVRTTAEACLAAKGFMAHVLSSPDADINDAPTSQGVSANLCGAVAELVSASESDDVELRFAWSPRWTRPSLERIPFTRREAEALSATASALRERALDSINEVSGRVERLSSEDPDTEGVATIRASIGGRTVLVDVRLPATQYRKATQAHTSRSAVRAVGTVKRVGRTRMIDDCEQFELIGDLLAESWTLE